MAQTIDLRTYILLERAFVRRLQRSWRLQSAPIYAKITQACLDHQWDTARRYVTDLDLTEVGTENREWITYMLLSCAVFGANTVAKGKPSFVGVGSFDTFLKQTTNNLLQYLEHRGTAQVQAEALQSIAEDEAKTKALPKVAWEEAQHPRDKDGQFTDTNLGLPEGVEDTLEGRGGPARNKWWHLNKAVMDTFDAFFEAKEARKPFRAGADRRIAELLAKKPDASADEINAAMDSDPEYVRAKVKAQAAQKAHQEAEAALKQQEPLMRKEVVTNLITPVALQLGVDPQSIHVVNKEAPGFDVGSKHFTEGGHYDPNTGQIEINAQSGYSNAVGMKGLAAHEISHKIYHRIKQEVDEEFQRYLKKATTPDGSKHSDWYHERFETVPGTSTWKRLKPEYRAEMEKEFPAAAAMSLLGGGEFFTGISQKMVEENGHSAYAKSYWAQRAIENRGHSYDTAINETIAEVTRYLTYPESWQEAEKPYPYSPWVLLTKAMHKWYLEGSELRKAATARLRASQGYHPPDAKGRKYGETGYNT